MFRSFSQNTIFPTSGWDQDGGIRQKLEYFPDTQTNLWWLEKHDET